MKDCRTVSGIFDALFCDFVLHFARVAFCMYYCRMYQNFSVDSEFIDKIFTYWTKFQAQLFSDTFSCHINYGEMNKYESNKYWQSPASRQSKVKMAGTWCNPIYNVSFLICTVIIRQACMCAVKVACLLKSSLRCRFY